MKLLTASISRALTSRRGAWLSLAVGLLLLFALLGAFSRATMSATNQSAPPESESARVAALADEFPDADDRTLIVVASTADGTTLTATGLGAYIARATETGDFHQILTGVAVMSVYVVGLNRLLWRRLYRVAENRYAL